MNYKERLQACGFEWPVLNRPDLPFAPAKRIGTMLYVSGQIPEVRGEIAHVGRVGRDIDAEVATTSAALCAANIVYWACEALNGDLDRVVQLAKLTVFINAIPDFTAFSEIGNGASAVMNAVFAERGEHARCAIGVGGLPANVPVEVDAVFHVR